jgi:AbrB family looped-hinge helix DNA binding protein
LDIILDTLGQSAILISGFTDYQKKIMSRVFKVQVGRRGVITLPKELREHNDIQEGDTLTLIELGDGVVVMSPIRSQVDAIADKLASEWQDSGESLETMLAALREVRSEYDSKNH